MTRTLVLLPGFLIALPLAASAFKEGPYPAVQRRRERVEQRRLAARRLHPRHVAQERAGPGGAPLTRRAWRATSVLVALTLAGGCTRGQPALRSGQARGANVLLVTIDTLRRDRVGAFGDRRGLTPTLDRIAASGIRYTRAYSHVPMTLPAHTSILTGLTPRRHGVRNNTTFRLDQRVPTLATMLKGIGYRTGAFVGAFVLDARFGLNRGFDEYDDRFGHSDRATFHFAERRASDVLSAAGNWILQPVPNAQPSAISHQPSAPGAQPWFAWVHLFDPHAPYDAPGGAGGDRAPYDAEVAYTDAMLGQFLDRLRADHALDRTIVVVTADHGESLGEHGETTHGLFGYNATIAVPLMIAGPAIAPGEVNAPVAHIDLTPTILDLVGGPIPPGLDGRSLVQPPPRDRPIAFEALDASLTRGWAPLYGVIQDGWKFIDLPDAELYDLAADPGEQRNRAGADPRGEVLKTTLRLLSEPVGSAPAVSLDSEAAGRLRSLGYSGGSVTSRRSVTAADDPKRLVTLHERFTAALTTFDGGHPEEALSAFRSILDTRPDFISARASAATVLLALGRPSEAVRLLREAPADQADAGDLLAKLGSALRGTGDLKGAAAALERARDAGNQNPEVLNDLAVAYAGLGRPTEARTLFDALLARAPGSATTWFNFGLFELQARRNADAASAFRRAVQIEPSYGDAWYALGSALVNTDRRSATDAWRQAEHLLPRNYDLLFNLGMLLADGDSPADARPYLSRFVQEAPRARYAEDIARVRSALARLDRRPS
ncbi:MAG: sulfatase-like hydrolase/transferase [Acidobacteria bacterium]|nr:sulfatase-like hydrolase/transferase [Acidobacteriota bacterium]